MPPFDFGKQTGRAFVQSFQAAQDRKQKAKRQRALQRFRRRRLEHLAEKARKDRQLQRDRINQGTIEVDRGEAPYLPGQGTVRMGAGTVARQRRRQQKMNFMQMRELLKQPSNGNMEVQRQNVPQLPGTGPAMVDPDTLIRHGGGTGGSQGTPTGSGGGGDSGSASTFTTPQETREALKDFFRQEQEAAEAGVSTDSLGSIQERIEQGKAALDSLTMGRPDFQGLQQQAMDSTAADTSRTDTTAAADSTTTRGSGRTPQGNVPSGLGADRSDAPGGGGVSMPSHSLPLDPQRLSGTSLNQRGVDDLASTAMQVLAQSSPTEARRRLDQLVEQGSLDASKRDSVWSRVQQVRREFSRRFGQQ